MVRLGAYIRNVGAPHGNRTRHTFQGDGGEDDGTLDPPVTLPISYATLQPVR